MATEIHKTVATCPIYIPKLPSNPKERRSLPYCPILSLGRESQHQSTHMGQQKLPGNCRLPCSHFFEVDKLASTSAAITRKLSTHFTRHGIPETVISDYGPQFAAAEKFQNVATSWDFKHITSSPGYPQSNGLDEKTVQTIKNIFDKAKSDGRRRCSHRRLLEYRTTPIDDLASPAQLLMGRQLHSILPATSRHLQPIDPDNFASRRQHLQAAQKIHPQGRSPTASHEDR